MLTRTMFGVVVTAVVLTAAPAAFAATASPVRTAAPAALRVIPAAHGHRAHAAPSHVTRTAHARRHARHGAHARHRARAAVPSMTATTGAPASAPRRAPRPATPRQPRRASLPHSRTLSRDLARFRSLPAGVAGDAFTLPGRPDSGWLFRPDPDARIATRCGCVVPARGPPCAEGPCASHLRARPRTDPADVQAALFPIPSSEMPRVPPRPGAIGAGPWRSPDLSQPLFATAFAVDTPTASRAGAACFNMPPKRGRT